MKTTHKILVVQLLNLGISILNNFKLSEIMGKQDQIVADLQAASAKLQKIGTETRSLITKVTDLQTQIDNMDNVTPELQAASDDVKAQLQIVDDLVPDVTDGTTTGTEGDGTVTG